MALDFQRYKKPSRWPVIPKMTAAPYLWSGCVFLVPCWLEGDGSDGSGSTITTDVVASRQLDTTDGESFAWGSGQWGSYIKRTSRGVSTTVCLQDQDYFPVTGSDPRTVVLIHEHQSSSGSGVMCQWGDDALTERWTWRYDNDSLRLEVGGDGYTTSLSPAIGELSVSAVVHDGADLGDTFVYFNGQTESTTSSQAVATGANDFGVHIGGDPFDRHSFPSGEIFYLWAIWDRALLKEELDQIYNDPFAMIRPGPQVIANLFGDAGAAGTTINAAVATLSTATQTATISRDTAIQAALASLSIAPQQATVSRDTDIAANAASLSIAEQTGSIALDIDVVANTATLSIASQASTIQIGTTVSASTATLALAEQVASIAGDTVINAQSASLTATEQGATTSLDTTISANVASILAQTFASSIGAGTTIDAQLASLSITELTVTIDTGGPLTLDGTVTITAALDGTITVQSALDGNITLN